MSVKLINGLIEILRKNKDLYAWKTANMSEISPNVIFHKLSITKSLKKNEKKKTKSSMKLRNCYKLVFIK